LGRHDISGCRRPPAARLGAALLCLAVWGLAVPFSAAKDIPCTWTGVSKIIVIGDLHGDYDNFEKIIKGIGLVDGGLHWIAGDTHFVQTGDVMDRGPNAKAILDVLMSLEGEAEAAGGKVHVLIGNHEEMNIGGIIFRYPDYISNDQLRSFLPDKYRQRQERELEKRLNIAQARGDRTPPEKIAEEFWNSLKYDQATQREYLVNFNNKYGKWLLQHNIIIKIDETVFVHGGISEKFSLWGMQKINDRYRKELTDVQRAVVYGDPTYPSQLELAYRGDGPLWYRDLANVPEADMKDEVDRILANLGAKHLVIAHTPRTAVTLAQMKRFGGKVWIVDTGISRAYNNNLSALKIINGQFSVWGGDHEEKDNAGTLGAFSDAFRRGDRPCACLL
jgi:Calcineurin-like phosphoesterase